MSNKKALQYHKYLSSRDILDITNIKGTNLYGVYK